MCGTGGGSLLLIKTNYLGIPEWEKIIGDSILNYRATSIQQTFDSGLIMTGDVANDSLLLLKTNKYGDLEWKKTFTNPNGQSKGFSIKITKDKRFIMCGYIFYFTPPGVKAYIVKTDSIGNLQWSNEYDNLTSQEILQTFDEKYYFVGGGSIKKINSKGELLWVKPLGMGIPGLTYIGVGDILQYSNDVFFVGGGVGLASGYPFNMYLSKLDSSGAILWQNYYLQNSDCSDICITSSGDITMVGSVYSDSINPVVNVAIVKVNQKGNVVYSKRINSKTNIDGDGYAVKSTNDNGFIITGITEYGGSSFRTNVIGIKTDSLGNTSSIVNVSNISTNTLVTFILHQNYPNPINPFTKINYELEQDAKVELVVYNILGKEIKILINSFQKVGSYSIYFDGSNIPAGIYIYRLKTNKFSESKKMLLIK